MHPEVDAYIQSQPETVRAILGQIRNLILECAPDAIENMAYGMPAYKLNKKPLVYFAAFQNHIGFYATPSGHSRFQEDLKDYKQGKGSVQFPFERPIPFELIEKIVRFRAEENKSSEALKR